ncbi:GNAT family N-acetyltransferase [Erythrobacter litoralis]|nr:GNAT family N-acetyltransferase [Erythrobacter litoralis]
MAYSIRPFRESDATDLVDVTEASIEGVGRESYSVEQVDAWKASQPAAEDYLTKATLGSAIFVAEDGDDRCVAYVVLERDGHLDRLYTHPDHARHGLAGQLLAVAEQYAKPHRIERLFTEASDLARPAFEQAGYKMIARRNIEVGGVAMHNWAMEKRF